ncbi:MAG: diaminopimelate epimerase [Candidatus Methylomirabilota bacterium]
MRFTKMHGAGNDYVYVNGFTERIEDPPQAARRLADRHFGIGGDGLILILPSATADLRMRIWNADGSEAEMCGNGIRCVAKYASDRGLVRRRAITVETGAGVLALELFPGPDGKVGRVRVDMGMPRIARGEIPMLGGPEEEPALDQPLPLSPEPFRVTAVSMGNPHCVLFVEAVEHCPVALLGPRIETHPVFPRRTNVEFVELLSRTEVRQRTWERGSGETLACGTGAAAVCVAGALTGRTERRILVHLEGGDLEMEWAEDGRVFMTGPAVEVFSGEIDLARWREDENCTR